MSTYKKINTEMAMPASSNIINKDAGMSFCSLTRQIYFLFKI